MLQRFLPDTNFYGLIVADSLRTEIHRKIHEHAVLLFGFDVIRKELRNTPRTIIFHNKNLRIDLLSIYDDLVRKTYNTGQNIQELAENYFTAYKGFGGNVGKDNIMNDFLIVACATLKQMEVLISDDKHSLLAEDARKAYTLVNSIRKLKTPCFINYQKFKDMLMKSA